jgi:hypothetical protein
MASRRIVPSVERQHDGMVRGLRAADADEGALSRRPSTVRASDGHAGGTVSSRSAPLRLADWASPASKTDAEASPSAIFR